eukprot:1819726-Prymnesium_polylepis.1
MRTHPSLAFHERAPETYRCPLSPRAWRGPSPVRAWLPARAKSLLGGHRDRANTTTPMKQEACGAKSLGGGRASNK